MISSESALEFLLAVEEGETLVEKLRGLCEALRRELGAEGVALRWRLGDQAVCVAQAGHLEDEATAGIALAGDGELLLHPPSWEDGHPLVDLTVMLANRELETERRLSKARVSEQALSSLTHELNNALTPLLCHRGDEVVREAQRLRRLVETLRQIRGTATARQVSQIPHYMAGLKKLLSLAHGGIYPVEVECSREVLSWAIGPEQGDLLPGLLYCGFMLRAQAVPQEPLRLEAYLQDDAVRFALSTRVANTPALAGSLELPRFDFAECGCEWAGDKLKITTELLARPRVILFGRGRLQAQIVAALGRTGMATDCAIGIDEVLVLSTQSPPRWAVVVVHESRGEYSALRRQLSRHNPLLAMSSLIQLDESGLPLNHQPNPGDLDLAEVVGGGDVASGSTTPRLL